MSGAHRALRIAVLALAVWARAAAVFAQQETPPESAADAELLNALAEQAAMIASMRQRLTEDPTSDIGWATLLDMESMQVVMRRSAGQLSPEEAAREQDALQRRILDEWRAARPGHAGPDLFEANIERERDSGQDPSRRLATLRAIADRHPDSEVAIVALASQLQQEGEGGEAQHLATTFLASHPHSPQVYSWLAYSYEQGGNRQRAGETRQAWLEAMPEDPQAWQAALMEVQRSGTAEGREQRFAEAAMRALQALQTQATVEVMGLCSWIAGSVKGDSGLTAAAIDCLGRVEASARLPETREQAREALAGALIAAGDPGVAARRLAALPAERRPMATLSMGSQLAQAGRCDEAVALVQPLRDHHDSQTNFADQLASSLSPCSSTSEARAFVLELLETRPVPEIAGALRSWAPRLPFEVVSALLERRLAREEGEHGRDLLYETAARLFDEVDERRLRELLVAWHRQARPSDRKWTLRLIDLHVAEGAAEAAAAVARRALLENADSRYVDQLVQVLLRLGDVASVAEGAAQLALDPEPSRAALGHRLHARVAAVKGNWPEAEGSLRRSLEIVSLPETARELAGLLAVMGQAEEVLPMLEHAWDQMPSSHRPSGGRERYLADELDEAGLQAAALPFWRQALARSPGDLALYDRIARTAMELERWDDAVWALRQRIALAPAEPYGWTSLLQLHRERGDTKAIEAVLAEARAALPETAAGGVEIEAGRRLLEQGRLVEAGRTLRAAYRANPYATDAREMLADIYRQMAPGGLVEVGPDVLASARTEAAAASVSSGEDLLLEAEALGSGTGGRVDLARSTALYERAAELGSPRAMLQVANLLRLGRNGLLPDPRRARQLAREAGPRVRLLARSGDPFAHYVLGLAAEVGLAGPADLRAAIEHYRAAAEGGLTFPMHNLGRLYEQGRGVPRDPAQSLAWYRRAAEKGNAAAMFSLGVAYLHGGLVTVDRAEARRWLEGAASAAHPGAMAFHGSELLAGDSADIAAGIGWLRRAAEVGHPYALFSLGHANLYGVGVPRDVRTARELFARAAAGGDSRGRLLAKWLEATPPRAAAEASDNLDLIVRSLLAGADWGTQELVNWHQRGDLSREEAIAVVARLRPGADSGVATAQGAMAALVWAGIGAEVDEEAALAWARAGARGGSAHAMRLLGTAEKRGSEGMRDPEVFEWLLRSADAGDSIAMLWAGRALLDGDGVAVDSARGLELLERSAASPNYYAMRDLAWRYEMGWPPLARDLEKARQYYSLAAGLGDAEAAGWLTLSAYVDRD